jgi:FeS assembly SUF system regulator
MLRISKLTDYGTVILACLAAQPDRLWTAAEVAERTHVGQPTVSKLLKKLQRSGLVRSTRGSHGGYQLARPAAEITAARILDALDGPFAITECSGQHSHCGIESSCRPRGSCVATRECGDPQGAERGFAGTVVRNGADADDDRAADAPGAGISRVMFG